MTPLLRSLSLLAILAAILVVVRRTAVARPDLSWPVPPRWLQLTLPGILASSIVLWQWGGFRATPVVYDESAYLLQAELLAGGHWSRPSPPAPVAFTQSAVLVTPVLAPKMPPGHAILLAIGVLMRLPGLVPVVLVGLTATMIMLLVTRLTSPGTGAIAVVLWITQAAQGRWRASYFSENTTTFLWLFGWWALLQWRDTRKTSWLIALAVAVGWSAITRPLTAVAFALPVAVIVLRDTVCGRHWRQLGLAIAAGTACLMLLPLQNIEVLGAWNRSPLTLYTRQYLPFDKMGFGYDSLPPDAETPPFFASYATQLIERHREHQPPQLGRVLMARLRVAANTNFGLWRQLLVPVALLALFVLPLELWIAVGTSILLYLCYLGYAHEPHWSAYYAESTPVTAAVIACGAGWIIARLMAARGRSEVSQVLVAMAILLWAIPDLARWRSASLRTQQPFRQFTAELEALPEARVIVFVRHAPDHDPDASLVRNVAQPEVAHALTAFDLGSESRAAIRAAYPDRSAYIWDESSHRLVRDIP